MALMTDLPDYLEGKEPKPYGWRTIDSAPKDGSIILLWNGLWHSIGEFGYFGENRDAKWFDGHYYIDATHWMPLPNPPVIE